MADGGGAVIDVFPPSAEEPVRLDLFGDTLESIRAFDPETQRSTKQLTSIDLLPVSEAGEDEIDGGGKCAVDALAQQIVQRHDTNHLVRLGHDQRLDGTGRLQHRAGVGLGVESRVEREQGGEVDRPGNRQTRHELHGDSVKPQRVRAHARPADHP